VRRRLVQVVRLRSPARRRRALPLRPDRERGCKHPGPERAGVSARTKGS